MKLTLNFNDALSEFLGSLPPGTIATQECEVPFDGKSYRLTVVCQRGSYRLALWDEVGEACPGFEVGCMGYRLTPEGGELSIDLGKRSDLELASLTLYLNGSPLGSLQIVPEMPPMTAIEVELALEQRETWRYFFQMRTCPPLEALKTGSVEAQRHLAGCAWCAELVASVESNRAWAELAEAVSTHLPGPQKPEVGPGQIWSLDPNLEGWDHEGRYVRAPQVMVVSGKRSLQVVPVCPETALTGERDVLLGAGIGFAEAWNHLTLPTSILSECWATVDNEPLEQVIERSVRRPAEFAEAVPEWRHAFEILERHVAETVEKRAAQMALSPQRVPDKERHVSRWTRRFTDTLHALFPAPAFGDMVLAAADSHTMPLRYFTADADEVKAYQAELTGFQSDPSGIHVSGKLLVPENMTPSLVYGWLKKADGSTLEAMRAEMAGLYFTLDFHGEEGLTEDNFRLAVISYGA